MKLSKKLFFAGAAVGVLGGTLFAQNQPITIKGSDTMVLLGQKWAETYMRKNPGTQIQVTGGGSGVGIAALINGSTDICEASRPMKEKEKTDLRAKRGKLAVEIPVAVDGLALYVHFSNPVKVLTLDQLKRIYLGGIKDWKEVGGNPGKIIAYGRENSSGTYAYFKEHVLANADFPPPVQALPGTAAIINAVAKDLRSIGYGGVAYGRAVKAILIKKDDAAAPIAPTMENVMSGQYPISRFLYWYFAGEPADELLKMKNWVLSAEGQKLVEAVGYYPLPKKSATVKAAPKKSG